MLVEVSNNITITNPSYDLKKYAEKHLVLSNPEYYVAQKMGRWLGNISKNVYLYENRSGKLILPFGTAKNIWSLIREADLKTDFTPHYSLSMLGSIPLYKYQEKAINGLVEAKNGILEAPCGSGKTQIGIGLIKALGQKALWLTHTGDLLKQSMDRAKEYFDGDFGTITGGKVNIGKDITFATVQTMAKLDLQQYAKEWNVVIVDECHRVAGSPLKVMQFYKVLTNLKARHKFGLSATLHRSDSMIKSTYALLGEIVYKISDDEVQSKIMKAEHQTVLTHIADQFERYTDTDGTLNYISLINFLCNHSARNTNIVRLLKQNRFRYNLVLSARVEHLKNIQRLLKDQGLQSEVVVGSVDKEKRAEIFEKMRSGKLHYILATYSLAKEGLDIPNLDTLHLATPQKDKAVVLQSAGRIERRIDGKNDALIYDYVDSEIPYCMAMYKKRKNILKRGKRK